MEMQKEKEKQESVRSNEYLFDEHRLTCLPKWDQICQQLQERGKFKARPLDREDYSRGYIDLLGELTEVGQVDESAFKKRFDEMRRINEIRDHYLIVVIEDTGTNQVIAGSTLFMEHKFIHECADRARLEDVVVSSSYRGKRLGEILVSIIVAMAQLHSYKLSLDCTDDLRKFYRKNGFQQAYNMMQVVFKK